MHRPPFVLPAVALVAAVLAGCAPTTSPTTPSPSSAAPTATSTPSESLLTDEIAQSTAVGALAPDFPSDLVPVPPGAEVLVSSAEALDDGRLRISLNVRTEQETAALVDAVRGPLVAAGFTESAPAAPEAALAAQTTFTRSDGREMLVVGVLDRDDARTMTLGGHVLTPSP